MISRRRFHRLVFCAAGIYNIGWGLYAVWDPQWFFRFAALPRSTIVLRLTDDLIWWVPFSVYLSDAWPAFITELSSRAGK